MSQAVRELQPFGAPMTKNAFETQPSTRSGVMVLEPAVAPRPYHASPQVKVASQPVPQLTTSRLATKQAAPAQAATKQSVPAQAQTKIASTPAPTSATHGDPHMTQLNQAKLASGIGVLDTLAGRQIDAATYIKQASASNHPALQASADDAYYALKVAQVAPDVFNRACEMVYGVQKQANAGSKALDVAQDVARGVSPPRGPAGNVSARALSPDASTVSPRSVDDEWFDHGMAPDERSMASGLNITAPSGPKTRADAYAYGGGVMPASPALGDRLAARAQDVRNLAMQRPLATGAAAAGGGALLGLGGYGLYEGLRDRPWYEQLGNAVGM